MNKTILTAIVLFVISISSNAQVIEVKGIIKEQAGKTALPFANIYLENSYLGTVSNGKGAFQISIPAAQKKDSLVISYIGYHSQKISIAGIKGPLEIFLAENTTTLSEVVVSGLTANAIIERAISNIPVNYNQSPYQSTGFYRVTAQKDHNYIHLSEAVFDIYQARADHKQQFLLQKMRAIKDEKASKGIDLGLKPSGIYEFDIVNHPNGTNLLTKKGLKLHHFKLEGHSFINDREVFKITFDQKDVKKSGFKGYMLIDKTTFAFVYFDFQLSPKGIAYHQYGDAPTRALMKVVGIDIEESKNSYQIRYKKYGNHYYLNNAGHDATLSFSSERDHYNFTTDTRVDYLISNIATDHVIPFSKEETLGRGKFIEAQNSIYDPDFWKHYNIILPSSDFNAIASKLEANNLANDLKIKIEERLAELPKDQTTRIDSILSFYNNQNLFNGTALITYNGETMLHKSYNNSFTENSRESLFRIGSISKTFTAMIVAQLEKEGKLSFTDPVRKFIPNFVHGDLTIHHLLSHQSGIPDFLKNKDYLPQILVNEYTNEAIVRQFCSDALAFQPGAQFEYSNANYAILSLIAERVLKQTYPAILSQYIFKPLGMSHSYFGDSLNLNPVTGFLYGKPEPRYPLQNVVGAGGITSTAPDLLKWSHALDGEQLLPIAKFGHLIQPKAAYSDWDAHYGYGWMIDRYMFTSSKRHKTFYHPGTDFGFYAMFVKQPANGITIILLNNTGEFPRFEITELILNELN